MPLDVMGLFFFAYRDFVGDADALLEHQGFGRAHHRVLYFVNLKPGMPVADILDILKITKQSLARVLRQLIDNGYIEQKTGDADRRQTGREPGHRAAGPTCIAVVDDRQRQGHAEAKARHAGHGVDARQQVRRQPAGKHDEA